MANIHDVARRAGVSTSTVSNVLNGRTDQMTAQTLARIRVAITELGYRPNKAARQLKTGQSAMLGLLVPSIVNPYFATLARAVDVAAQERHGFRVLLGNTYRDKEKEEAFFDDLLGHGVRGVIVVSTQVEQPHFESAIDRGLIMVTYDARTQAPNAGRGLRMDSVSVDNYASGHMAASHLIERGARRLAFATESGKTVSRSDKIEGFLAACREGRGVEGFVIEDKAQSGYGDAEMSELGKRLAIKLDSMADPPDGVVAVNDMLAIGMIAGLKARNIRVPEDVSIVGIDDMFLSDLITPALTSVSPPVSQMAAVMVDRVVTRLADPSLACEEVVFPPTLALRESVVMR